MYLLHMTLTVIIYTKACYILNIITYLVKFGDRQLMNCLSLVNSF